MPNRADERQPARLDWVKKADGWWACEHRGYKLQICEEKTPMFPPAFLLYIDGQRVGEKHSRLDAAQAAAATRID